LVIELKFIDLEPGHETLAIHLFAHGAGTVDRQSAGIATSLSIDAKHFH
jgi:hypothetical protein